MTGLPQRQTQAQRRQQSEQALIEAAMGIVVEKGMSAVTFDAIGARAGYSRTLAPQKFGSKEGLVTSVLDYLRESRLEAERPDDLRSLSGMDALLTYVASTVNRLANTTEMQAYFIFLADSVAELSDTRELFAATHEHTKNDLVELFARGTEDGSIREVGDPEAAALMVGTLMVGLAMQWLINPQTDLSRVTEQICRVLSESFSA